MPRMTVGNESNCVVFAMPPRDGVCDGLKFVPVADSLSVLESPSKATLLYAIKAGRPMVTVFQTIPPVTRSDLYAVSTSVPSIRQF